MLKTSFLGEGAHQPPQMQIERDSPTYTRECEPLPFKTAFIEHTLFLPSTASNYNVACS